MGSEMCIRDSIDNDGALQLAKTKRLTPRTRYMAAKYFWFLDKILAKEVTPKPIDGKIQLGDIMTKTPTRRLSSDCDN